MPGLNGTGPMGMGPMTGGARGWCNPYGFYRRPYLGAYGSMPLFGWGRGRGWRHWYWATGLPRWMRFGSMGTWGHPGGYPWAPHYSREDEMAFLRDQASALREDLEAIEKRLKALEAEKE